MAINYAPNFSPWATGFGNNQLNYSGNQFQTPTMYPTQQVQAQQDDNSLMAVFVQGESGANLYPVRSGTTVMPIDFEAGKFWLKSNANGVPQRLRHFVFHEVFPEQEQHIQASQASNAITREEFNSLANNVNSLANDMKALLADLGGGQHE